MSIESADSLLQQGNQAFVNDDFSAARELYSQALQLEPSTKLLANRAAASLKLEDFDGEQKRHSED